MPVMLVATASLTRIQSVIIFDYCDLELFSGLESSYATQLVFFFFIIFICILFALTWEILSASFLLSGVLQMYTLGTAF